ncbi:MAG: dihydrofolate reductase [Chloroflexota bacterium]
MAMDENRGIGVDNRLPWHLSEDLKRFKKLTMGHHLIVGRKTVQSIGQALPGREIIILSRHDNFFHEKCHVVPSLDDAIQLAKDRGETEVFIAGGGQVYAQALPLADRIYLTYVHAVVPSDTYFPEFDRSEWVEVKSTYQEADQNNDFAATFKLLVRKRDALKDGQ